MITKNLYDEAMISWNGEVDYFEIFMCVVLTPITVIADILTSPFQAIALIVGKIIEKRK